MSLLPHLPKLKELISKKKLRFILASGSKRRRDIFDKCLGGLDFEVIPSSFAEDLDKSLYIGRHSNYVFDNARLKCEDVFESIDGGSAIVVGSDTIVSFGGKILEKPKDRNEAREMLSNLSGNTHIVYTGVYIMFCTSSGEVKKIGFSEETQVCFEKLDNFLVEPFDKAGSYGIQSIGAQLVASINGCYFNVEGLPIGKFCSKLAGLIEGRY